MESILLQKLQSLSQKTGFQNTGDEGALLPEGLVLSCDQFLESTHFTWEQMSPHDIGYKGAVQALSDLAAMAAKPLGLLCSLAWPQSVSEDQIHALAEGVAQACRDHDCPWVGGDISRSPEHTYMDFSVLGRRLHPLQTIEQNDLLVVSGPIGSAHGGYLAWKKNISGYPKLEKAFRHPQAQISVALKMAEKNLLCAASDLSDSLGRSVHNLSTRSGWNFEVELEKIPRLPELEDFCLKNQEPLKQALLAGGEDYQLLMVLKKSVDPQTLLDHGLIVVGQVNKGQNSYIEGAKKLLLPPTGWDPFAL